MFDIGLTEILLILIVSLLVIGPDKLPATAKTLGLWWGRLKYELQSAKKSFEQEIGADEVRRQLHNEQIMRELGESQEAIKQVMRDGENSLRDTHPPQS